MTQKSANSLKATVVSQNHQLYYVSTNEKSNIKNNYLLAKISGQMEYGIETAEQYPVVGDVVEITHSENDDVAIIHRIFERKSLLTRGAAGTDHSIQPIVANVDTVFITMALNGNFNLRRIERYLTIVWDSGAQPAILLTKADLAPDIEQQLEDVQEIAAGVPVFVTSSEDYSQVRDFLIDKPQTLVFVGSSGVGKSTLINHLLGYDAMETKDVRYGDDKGRHTTTNRQLFRMDNGTQIIDTPGMRELQVDTGNTEATFEDIEKLAQQCKFRNCSHNSEPGCAIINAINSGELSESRFENYQKIMRENRYSGMKSSDIAADKFNRFFGTKSEAKRVRDIKKSKQVHR